MLVKQKRIYQGIIVVLLLVLLVFSKVSHSRYVVLVENNEKILETKTKNYEESVQQWEESVQQWEERYSRLQTDYGELLRENMRLEEIKPFRVTLPACDYTLAEVHLIAECVEAEAGYYEGHKYSQRYVTQVILNRLHSSQFPDSVEEVIYQKINGVPQFSVAYNGVMEEHKEVQLETIANVYEAIVQGTNLPEYVLYFYSASVTENWVNTLKIYDVVDGTVFAYDNKEEY